MSTKAAKELGIVRILILGDMAVGKTSLLLRFTDLNFTDSYSMTTGVNFREKECVINKENLIVQVWDTAGQEKYRKITATLYKKARGIVLGFDLTNQKSYENVKNWLKQIHSHVSLDVPIVIAATKCDKSERVVPESQGKSLASELGYRYYETSAKENINVDELFFFIASEVQRKNQIIYPNPDNIKIQNKGGKKKSSCC